MLKRFLLPPGTPGTNVATTLERHFDAYKFARHASPNLPTFALQM